MALSRAIANNIYTICGTPSLERRYPAFWNGGFTAQEYSVFSYLQELLANMTDWDHTDEYLEDLMPWSEFSRSQCCR